MVYSPSQKRRRGEGGIWAGERLKPSTPVVEDETPVEPVAEREREEIAHEEEEPTDTTAERATIEDEGEQPRSEGDLLGMRSSDPGSPTLRRGLIQNLVNLEARVPRLTPGMLGMHPAMMRAL